MAKDEEGFDRDMRTLFVAQVARKADERDLFQFFSECGKVVDVRIIKDSSTRRSKGIAYVEFEKQEMCVQAVSKSGQHLCGFPIVVQASQAEKNQAARLAAQAAQEANWPAKVQVSNLHADISEEDLTALFTPFGKVSSSRVIRENGVSTGIGQVEFQSIADAQKAVSHLNGFDLAGQPLKVELMAPPAGAMPVTGGPATEMLDDNELGGVHVSAQSRASLMQKLARNTDLVGQQPPVGMGPPPGLPPGALPPPGMMPPSHPPPPVGVPGAFMPAGQAAPSQYLLLNNMFDPAKEEDVDFHLDIQEDVKEECEGKFGQVVLVVADKANPNGLVYLQFDGVDSAVKAQAGLQGRFFAGKMISATYLAESVFHASLPSRCGIVRERQRDRSTGLPDVLNCAGSRAGG